MVEAHRPSHTHARQCGMARYGALWRVWRPWVLGRGAIITRGVCVLMLVNSFIVAYSGSRSAVIGLYVSYVTPIFLRITSGREKLVPGPFTLGKWYLPIGIVAVSWVTFITVLLLFPLGVNPTPDTMSESSIYIDTYSCTDFRTALLVDYAVVIIMGVLIFAGLSWILSARKWFKGPVRTVEEGDVAGVYDEKKAQVMEQEVSVHSS